MHDAGLAARDKAGGREDWKATPTPEQIAASAAESLFENVNRPTHDITDTLQDLILQMEPRTLDETLSLALIYKSQMVVFLCEVSSAPSASRRRRCKSASGMLERAMEAIIRGLVHAGKASSPLSTSYGGEDELIPWDQLLRRASDTAALYCDPATGRARRLQRKAEEEAP